MLSHAFFSGFRVLFMGPASIAYIFNVSLDTAFFPQRLHLCYPMCFLVGSVYCSWDLQVFFFNKNNFKTGSHDTIHIFKNYFTTVFSVFRNKWYPNRPSINQGQIFAILTEFIFQLARQNKNQLKSKFSNLDWIYISYFSRIFKLMSKFIS